MSETNPARPTVAWLEVLDQIDESLVYSLAHHPELSPTPETPEPARNPLARLDARLAAWQSSLAQVEKQAVASSERLTAEQEALTQWLDKLGQVRDGVARWLDAVPKP